MSITLDFILFFCLVVIPGLLFKRFYFHGEFSKQFNTKDSIYRSFFYSIIPGIIIQILGYLFYNWIHKPKFSFDNVILTFKEFISPEVKSFSSFAMEFLENDVQLFFIHELNVCILACVLGRVLYLFVRYFKLDIRWKVLRFKNQWYYVFSGEIKSFKKFIQTKNFPQLNGAINNNTNKYKYYPPYVDILVDEGESNSNLYSGYLIDYDLNYEDLNELDKVYLLRAHRYKKKKKGVDYGNLEIRGSRVKTPIKGDIFILKATNILNLNIDFLQTPLKEEKIPKGKNWHKTVFRIGTILNLFIILFFCFSNIELIKNILPFIYDYTIQLNILSRFFLALIFTQTVALAMPYRIEEEKTESEKGDVKEIKYLYSMSNFFSKLKLLIGFALVYYVVYYWFFPFNF